VTRSNFLPLALSFCFAASAAAGSADPYAGPDKPALPPSSFTWDASRTAVVVIDPQVDFVGPKRASWPLVEDSVIEQKPVSHLPQMVAATRRAGIVVAISTPYYYPHGHRWKFEGPAETVQHRPRMFDLTGALAFVPGASSRQAPKHQAI